VLQASGIFNKYIYETEDTIAEVTAVGYFSESRFALIDNDETNGMGWSGGIIECSCSNGYLIGKVTNDGLTLTNAVPSDSTIESKAFDSLTSAVAFVTANPAALERLSTDSYRNKAECLALSINYPDGGAADLVVEGVDGGVLADGVWVAGIKQLKLIPAESGEISSAVFGAMGQGDESVVYQALIDYCISNSIRYIRVDADQDTAMTLTNRSNVMFVGSGSFTGTNYDTGNYRRQVSKTKESIQPEVSSIKIKTEKTALTMVITGDSLTTFGPDVSGTDGLYLRITSKIQEENPGITFTFYGRGISGQTWAQLDGVANTSYPIADAYPWYTDDTRDWLDYISDLSPDYVLVSSGMNDRENFSRIKMESAIAKIEAFGADVVLATNFVPCLSPDPTYAQFGEFIGQEGRDYVAGYERTYAQFHDYPLIDINRTFNIIRDGRDILNTSFISNDFITFGTDSAYEAAVGDSCRDFVLECDIATGAWTNSDPVSLKVGPNVNNLIHIADQGGFLKFKFYRGDGSPNVYADVVSDIATPTVAGERCEITVKGGDFYFRFIQTSPGLKAGIQPFHNKLIRHGGVFQPQIGYYLQATGPLANMRFSKGVEEQFLPLHTDVELWGETNTSIGQKPVTGGNGVQHPSALGISAVYGAHFKNSKFKFDLGSAVDPALNTARLYLQTAQVIPSSANTQLLLAANYNGLGLTDNGDGTFSVVDAGNYVITLNSDIPANGGTGYGRVRISVGSRSSSHTCQIDAAQDFEATPVYSYNVPAGAVISATILQITGSSMTYNSVASAEVRIVKVS
jgi:hypothetical protein